MGERFGQHFLTDQVIINRIITAMPGGDFTSAIEIGPGRGALTKHLVDVYTNLHLVELDKRLIPKLAKSYPQAHLHQADALEFDYGQVPGDYVACVGNLPYEISSGLLFLLCQYPSITECYFMVQHEFALRASCLSGKDAGRLGIMLGVYFDITYDFMVPPTAFSPPPKVKSAMIHLKRHKEPLTAHAVELEQLLRIAFTQRRKMLRRSFKDLNIDFSKFDISESMRPQELSFEQWLALAKHVAELNDR